jgi:apolipoprotein N-acyltransferase
MKKRIILTVMLASAHIALMSLSFTPTSIYAFAWVGLVPIMLLLYFWPDKKSVFVVWITGFLFFLTNVYWVGIVTIAGYGMLSFYLSWYYLAFAVLFLAYRKLHRVWFLMLLPFTWVMLEYLRSFLLTGFPWYFVGHSQASWLPLIQIADIGGVYAITFIVVLGNVLATAVIISFVKKRQERGSAPDVRQVYAAGAAVLIFVAASLVYGSYRLSGTPAETGPRICLIQGNIPQSLKLDSSRHKDMFQTYYDLTKSVIGEDIDLLVWPETMAPGVPNVHDDIREFFESLSRRLEASLLIGAVAVEDESGEITDFEDATAYNSAYYFSHEKNGALDGRYDKVHLVPFGEYVPLKRFLPFLRRVVPEGYGVLTPGKDIAVFHLDDYAFSAAICYENSVAPLVRRIARERVDFLVVITNDGWFGTSKELDEHLTINVFRAIENRLPIVYSANTGISGFIDSAGRIRRHLRDGAGRAREVEGVLIDSVQIDRRNAVYTVLGDWFAFVCIAVCAGGIIPFRALTKKR